MRGPQPTPTMLLNARGSWRGKVRSKTEPGAGGDLPIDPPNYLNVDAKREWRRLQKILSNTQVAGKVDADALALYCAEYARWKAAEKGIEELGLVVKLSNGVFAENPYLKIAHKSSQLCHKLLAEFGMTPASRSRVKKVESSEKKPEGLLSGLTLRSA